MIRHVDPTRPRGPIYRAYATFSATRFGRWFSRNVAWKVDPVVLRLTGGRVRSGAMLPMALLETRGARSGAVRRNGVIYFHDGADVIVMASLAGAAHHPAWYHNLRAHPDVELNGEPMRASVVEDEAERARLWALADAVFPPFAVYRREAAPRVIPVVRLTAAP